MSFGRSDDGGQSWGDAWSVPLAELPAWACQPSLVSTPDGETLCFGAPMNTTNTSNPDRRSNYTVHSSTDGGRRWQWLAGVLMGPSGYSDMSVLPNGQLAALLQRGHSIPGVEGGGYEMAYARIDLGWAHAFIQQCCVTQSHSTNLFYPAAYFFVFSTPLQPEPTLCPTGSVYTRP